MIDESQTNSDGVSSENETKETQLKDTTLAEQGPLLPLGVPGPDDRYHKAIELRKWNLRKEKELGELRRGMPDVTLGAYVSLVLSEMCTQLGPHNFEKMNSNERRLAVSQMWMGDVLYAYSWLRYKALGSEIKLRLECPFHDHKFVFPADLDTLEVRTAETLKDATWIHTLNDPLEIRGTQVEQLVAGPVRWNAVEQANLGRRVNQGKVKAVMIYGSIHRVGDAVIALTETELDEMSKLDLENHVADIDERAIGPDMSVEARCSNEHCERLFETSIDWGYDSFFSTSSRSRRSARSTTTSSRSRNTATESVGQK